MTVFRKVKHGDGPRADVFRVNGLVGGIQSCLKKMEDECLLGIRGLNERSAKVLVDCAESSGVRRDPCLSGLIPGVQNCAVDSRRVKGYNVLVKLMTPFNKPLDLVGTIGAGRPCKADDSGKIKVATTKP